LKLNDLRKFHVAIPMPTSRFVKKKSLQKAFFSLAFFRRSAILLP